MAVRRRVDNLQEFHEKRNREAAASNAAAFLFVMLAESGQIDDTDIAAHAAIFPLWEENKPHTVGCMRRCPLCNDVFRCVDPPPVSERARNSRIPPSKADKFWQKVSADAACIDEGGEKV